MFSHENTTKVLICNQPHVLAMCLLFDHMFSLISKNLTDFFMTAKINYIFLRTTTTESNICMGVTNCGVQIKANHLVQGLISESADLVFFLSKTLMRVVREFF